MLPMTQIYGQITPSKELDKAIKLGNVMVIENAGGQSAPVKTEAYKEALQNALFLSNMGARAGDKEKYLLDANLLDLDVPFFGFDMTATAKAHYQLRRIDNGLVVVDANITLPYTAAFGESLDGNQRVRIATAKAIRENITQIIRVLASKTKEELLGKGK